MRSVFTQREDFTHNKWLFDAIPTSKGARMTAASGRQRALGSRARGQPATASEVGTTAVGVDTPSAFFVA